MWLLTKHQANLLWIEISTEEDDHFILPIFTSPDTAMGFLDDLQHNGERVILSHINSIEQLTNLSMSIESQQASAIILDAPNPDTLTSDDELVYWTGEEFCDILKPLIEMAETYGDKRVLEVLDQYLNNKVC